MQSPESPFRALLTGLGCILVTTGFIGAVAKPLALAMNHLMGNPHHESNWGVGILMLPLIGFLVTAALIVTVLICLEHLTSPGLRGIAILIGLGFWLLLFSNLNEMLKVLPFVVIAGRETSWLAMALAVVQALVGAALLWLIPSRKRRVATLCQEADLASRGSRG
jgi:hypothetical protein